MENFTVDESIDFNKKENRERLLKEHQEFMESKFVKPLQEKNKEYETKVNSLEEQQIFSNVKDTKKVDLIKNLMITDKYKDLSKQEAFNKINEDYKDFLIDKEQPKPETTPENQFNPKLILDLHNNSIDPDKLKKDLDNKAKTTGISDEKELGNYIELMRNEALKSIK